MTGAGLTQDSQVAGYRQIAGHADLLPAGHAHAVDAADGGLLAIQDGVHHADEQIHVLTVLVGPLRIVLRILLGVAAGAEGLVTGAGKDHRHHTAVRERPC